MAHNSVVDSLFKDVGDYLPKPGPRPKLNETGLDINEMAMIANGTYDGAPILWKDKPDYLPKPWPRHLALNETGLDVNEMAMIANGTYDGAKITIFDDGTIVIETNNSFPLAETEAGLITELANTELANTTVSLVEAILSLV